MASSEMSDSNCCCVHIVCSTCSPREAPVAMDTRGTRQPRTRSRQFAIATRDGSHQRISDSVVTRNNSKARRGQVAIATRNDLGSSHSSERLPGNTPARTQSRQYAIATRDGNQGSRQIPVTTRNKKSSERINPERDPNSHQTSKSSQSLLIVCVSNYLTRAVSSPTSDLVKEVLGSWGAPCVV